jgi:hypothetical protein
MLKSIQRGFSNFFTPSKVLILVVFGILAWALMTYSNGKTLSVDGMDTGAPSETEAPVAPEPEVKPVALESNYTETNTATPSELLPQDQNSQWAALNPVAQGNIAAPDLLQAGYHIGLDTIGQTLKNANLQERSDPIIDKRDIGPWHQSTIEPDLGRVPLEVGPSPLK